MFPVTLFFNKLPARLDFSTTILFYCCSSEFSNKLLAWFSWGVSGNDKQDGALPSCGIWGLFGVVHSRIESSAESTQLCFPDETIRSPVGHMHLFFRMYVFWIRSGSLYLELPVHTQYIVEITQVMWSVSMDSNPMWCDTFYSFRTKHGFLTINNIALLSKYGIKTLV